MNDTNFPQSLFEDLFLHPNTPYQAYPFPQITNDLYLPAFREGIRQYREELQAIYNNPAPPTFENTIAALEHVGALLEAVEGVFFNLLEAETSDELMQIAEEITPELAQLGSETILSQPLFQRISTVYQNRANLSLDEADVRLLENCYYEFSRGGAQLPEEQRAQLSQLREQLSLDTLTFGNNVIKEEKAFALYVQDESAVAPLPKALQLSAREKAVEKGYQEGYLFDLSFPHYSGVLKDCPNEEIRKEMYLAKATLCCKGGETDNQAVTKKIVNTRLAIAQMLGYSNYAQYALERRMLNTPERVIELLSHLRDSYKETAIEERKALEELKGSPLNPWDVSYYTERFREKHFAFEQEQLRPYFPLARVVDGVLGLASKLYNLEFVSSSSIPVYHHDVKPFEVWDRERDTFIGLLYLDFFPRKGKRSGAWMNNLREQEGTKRPHILLVMNFTPPTEEMPALLLPNEVNTFLHEFGHGLHGLLTQAKYSSLSGTNVERDFVELPSQIMENWLTEPDFVRSFALHYKTQEPIPTELLQKMIEAQVYPAGYNTLRQLSFGFLDMAYHTLEEPMSEQENLSDFEKSATLSVRIAPPSEELKEITTMVSTSFGHLFSGGYAAGYYGYKWSEVLDADAFALFQEKGIFSQEVAQSFRSNILEKGDLQDPMQLYVAFRGREPQIDALLKRDGIQS